MENKTTIVIPARYNSKRLPGKVLLKINDKTIIQLVYEQAIKVKNCDRVIIATDSQVVVDECNKFTENVVLTSGNHKSGTDRIAEVCQNVCSDYIVNLQGDEPIINPNNIERFIDFMKSKNEKMYSMYKHITSESEVINHNIPKVIIDVNGFAIYFSRSPIPYYREIQSTNDNNNLSSLTYFKHIGIYGYRKEFLLNYSELRESYLERVEKLEQLRAIENGFKICMMETEYDTISIDTYEDYINLKKYMNVN
jgi:3-deoxy-manno-octulosonate cytidylyltransferase (CMP-KDO synthetase)